MNILFAIKKNIYSAMEPIGILYLSSILKKNGHSVFLTDASIEKVSHIIKEENIGLFAISCMNTEYKYYLDLSQKIKHKFSRIPIIWGGPTPTFSPEIIKQNAIDIICRGEGENALLELVNRIEHKWDINKIPNLWIKKNSVIYKNPVGKLMDDLDLLPFPDRYLAGNFSQFRFSPIKTIIAGRGSPFNCSFCFNHKIHELYKGKGKIIRNRSVENLITELADLKKNFNAKFFYFLDDVFPFEKKWLSDFAERYSKEIRLPFTIVTSVIFIDREFVRLIKKAGCISIHLAIECGNEKIRRKILNKPISNQQIIKACNMVKSYGMAISAYNMVGIPFTKFEDELETLDLNLKGEIDATYVAFCLPFLNTKLGQMAQKAGLISQKTEFLSWFERIPIQIEERKKIEKFAYLFTFIVMFPALRRYLFILLKIPFPTPFLKFVKDIFNGYTLKTKIVPVKTSHWEFAITAIGFISKRFTK